MKIERKITKETSRALVVPLPGIEDGGLGATVGHLLQSGHSEAPAAAILCFRTRG